MAVLFQGVGKLIVCDYWCITCQFSDCDVYRLDYNMSCWHFDGIDRNFVGV